ncbi:hypothetical protein OIU84_015760 [Salix udensis]|uniref:Small ribosomal subunit protein uS9c n=1 Tax=Salix udensis TaxID=889485 RepID=A0AAD6J7K9_9ROSI|nr:hypothetical protein OIU84_015760 [Salix udensis]
MAISIAFKTPPLSPLSLSSETSHKPNNISFSWSNSLSFSLSLTLRVSATVASPEITTTITNLKKSVKSRLPGGFSAQSIHGTGRRKCALARVVLQEGTGKVIINYRDAKEYPQTNPSWLRYLKVPRVTLGYESSYDMFVKAGGDLAGQAQAISLGVARALLKVSQNHRIPLKREELLTRDSGIAERKKVGPKKARKTPQFSKR